MLRSRTGRIALATLVLALGLGACSSSKSDSNSGGSGGGPTSVSWTSGKLSKNPTFSGIGVASTYASLVLASFKPSNDAILLNPVNADFKTGDWLFSGTLKISDGLLTATTYSGPTLERAYLYYYDAERKQTYNQSLNGANEASVTITSVTDTTAKGSVKITDTASGYSISTTFTATLRKI